MKRLKNLASLLALAVVVAGCAGTDTIDLAAQSAGSAAQTAPATAASNQTAPATVPSNQTTATITGQSSVGAQTGPSVAAVATNARVQFAPVIGAAAEAVPPLAGQLSARAGQHGLAMVGQADQATHIVKGYFSTIADGGQTTVIYVWDVLDPAGNRLHRIQGQEKVAGGTEEGWASVTGTTMQTIANRTVDELVAWLQTRQS